MMTVQGARRHAELGDVDHACSSAGEAVPSIAAARSARDRRRLADLRAKVNTHRHAAVAALDEQVRALIARAGAAKVPP